MEWNVNGFAVTIYFPIRLEDGVEDFSATSVNVHLPYETDGSSDYNDYPYGYEDGYGYEDDYPYGYEDGYGYEDDYGDWFDSGNNTAVVDPDLVGRWRASDGGMLEIDSSGLISSVDFKCWTVRDNTPYIIYCNTDNGRVNCSAYFNMSIKYKFGYYSDGKEYIEFDNGAVYYRDEGKNGALPGYWRCSGLDNILGYHFYENGTGICNDKFQITWDTYDTGDGKKMLNYTLLDPTYFDYYVIGDMLTVYLLDGSRIYTRVGK